MGEALIVGSCCWKVFEQSEGGTLPNLGNKRAIDDVVLLTGQFAEFTLAFKKKINKTASSSKGNSEIVHQGSLYNELDDNQSSQGAHQVLVLYGR